MEFLQKLIPNLIPEILKMSKKYPKIFFPLLTLLCTLIIYVILQKYLFCSDTSGFGKKYCELGFLGASAKIVGVLLLSLLSVALIYFFVKENVMSTSINSIQPKKDLLNVKLLETQSEVKESGFVSFYDVVKQFNTRSQKLKNLPQVLSEYLRSKKLLQKYITDFTVNIDGSVQSIFKINDTRFSTFFAISNEDKSKILCYRRDNSNVTSVVNKHPYDCFGGVHFENVSLFKKLKPYAELLNANVLFLEEISGLAWENNVLPDGSNETVVMFGFLVCVDNQILENLDESLDELKLLGMNEIKNQIVELSCTSKLLLSYKHLENSPSK